MNENTQLPQGNRSEIAAFIAQWDAEMEALQRGIYGFAEGTARHAFINAQMDRLGREISEAPVQTKVQSES